MLVAHGEPGRILLGAEPITTQVLERQRALLLEWAWRRSPC
ncbi:DUF4347 domain-containing protein [Synechococcus sp. GFB01]|nr:DUF4347 domain-containing protein [Synechococcus sp. GFB01]